MPSGSPARPSMRSAGYDHVVAPSGSCAGMLKHHYPVLFAPDSDDGIRARALAGRCFELLSYLVDVQGVEAVDVRWPARVAYHDCCSGLRELGIKSPAAPAAGERARAGAGRAGRRPRSAAASAAPSASNTRTSRPRWSTTRSPSIEASGADLVLAGDLGCLINIAGRLHARGFERRGPARRRGAGRHARRCQRSASRPPAGPPDHGHLPPVSGQRQAGAC